MVKTYPNTKKGRNEIPKKPGAYNLKNKSGKTIYTGSTGNLKRRIAEHHSDPIKHFASVSITITPTERQAKKIEEKRLKTRKPSQNK